MSISKTSQQNTSASTTGRVTFLSRLNSGANSTRSSNEGHVSPNLELSKKEVFENNLTQLFTKAFPAALTSKDAVSGIKSFKEKSKGTRM